MNARTGLDADPARAARAAALYDAGMTNWTYVAARTGYKHGSSACAAVGRWRRTQQQQQERANTASVE